MFDIGFWELCLIAIVSLVVVGPDKIPGTVKSIILFIRKIKSSISSVQQSIEHEVMQNTDEISPLLKDLQKENHKTKNL